MSSTVRPVIRNNRTHWRSVCHTCGARGPIRLLRDNAERDRRSHGRSQHGRTF